MQRRAVFVGFHLQLGEKKGKTKKGNFPQSWEPDWVTLVINNIIIVLRIAMIIVIIKTISLIFLRMFELVGNPGGNKQRPCLGGFPTNGELWHISATNALEL